MSNKISATKQIFRIIDQDLDRLTTCDDMDLPMIVYRLKSINEELCDQVIGLVKSNEAHKSKPYEQQAATVIQQSM